MKWLEADGELEERNFTQEALAQLHLAAPVCVGFLSNRLVTTASTIIVGHLGERDLAAVGLAISLANVSGYTVLVGLSSTLQTTAGQAFGAKNFDEVSLSLQRCLLLCTVVLGAVGALWLNSKSLLINTGQEEAIADLAATYLAYLFPGLCCYMVTICLENWLAAQRVTKVQGTGGIILLAGFVPVCWFLVQPLSLGIYGAAIATSLGHLFLMLWMVAQTFLTMRSSLKMSWQGPSRRAFADWYPFLRLAVPSLFVISKRWASEIIVLLAGTLPDPEANLAAMTIFANTCLLLSMPPLSLGCAGNTRVSNELGAGCPYAAHFAAKVNYSLGLCLASVLSAAMLAGRCIWIHLITCNHEVLHHTKQILLICPLYVALDCMCTVTNGTLKGCGRQLLLAPVVSASYFLIGIPSAWLFAWPGQMSARGLALGSSVGTFAHCVAVSVILWTTNWVLMSRVARERAQAKPLLLR